MHASDREVERSHSLMFGLNGTVVQVDNPDPRMLLVDYLRSAEVGLTGTKLVCGAAGCGACTVMLSRYHPERGEIVHAAINSCVRPLCALDGMHITTVEGVGSTRTGLSPVQHKIAALNGSQCGYCTPGFVMNMHTLLVNEPRPLSHQIEDSFDGNICRCTGYRPILESMRGFAVDFDSSAFRTNHPCVIDETGLPIRDKEPVPSFPEELLQYAKSVHSLHFDRNGYQWFQPLDLKDLQILAREHSAGGVKLVGGNTSAAIYKDEIPHTFIDVSRLPELAGISADEKGVYAGAGTTLHDLIAFLAQLCPTVEPRKAVGLSAMHHHLGLIANVQVRNVGSMAGNIMMTHAHAQTDSPFPSDLDMLLTMLGASATLASRAFEDGSRTVAIHELPTLSDRPPDAVLIGFHIPYSRDGDHIRTFKIMPRPQAAHAVVNAGFRVNLDQAGTVRDATIAFGGIAHLTVRAAGTEAFLTGKPWTETTLHGAIETLAAEISELLEPLSDTQFLPPNYRADLAQNLFYSFFVAVACEVGPHAVSDRNRSMAATPARPLSSARQHLEVAPDEAPVGDPILSPSVFLQATGEAGYTQDIPLPPKGLHASPVLSRHARARFSYNGGVEAVETELLRRFPSVRALVTAADVPGRKLQGAGQDEPVFAEDEVIYWGQLIALVVGVDAFESKSAARWLAERIEYEDIADQPPILGIDAALAQPDGTGLLPDTDFMRHMPNVIRKGSDLNWLHEPAPLGNDHLVSGEQRTPGQAHFYMETQASLAFPDELGTMRLYTSTQNPANDQALVASLLDVPINDVQVSVRRLGGGYGGKQVRCAFISGAAAVAALKVNRPVRLVLDRSEDMQMVGKRHPSLGKYSVSVADDGTLHAMKFDLVTDGGCTHDVSFPVLDLAQQHLDGAYYTPTLGTTGNVARTNVASNTGMRSFGVVQATMAVEEAIEHAAHEIGMLPEDLRRKNLYATGTPHHHQLTHFGQALSHCIIREMWDRLWHTADFTRRHSAIEEFNRRNRWRKRGICMIPMKYGVGYQPRMLDQGGALVSIYAQDGSVLVQHGGIEMGQGIHTKMIQIAAETLSIPMNRIRVGDTWTGGVPNASATAASTGADLNGGAVKAACVELRRRLEKVCVERNIEGWQHQWAELWPKIVTEAYAGRVDLLAEGHYKEPYIEDVEYTHQYGHAFLYFCYAVGCSEVEINVLTGETTILRSDILFDAGQSLNPALDVGQVEGGFMQGVGMMLTEEIQFEENGRIFTDGTWTYKLPVSKSIPIDFRVALNPTKRHTPKHGRPLDPAAIQSSKGVGEPALTLASSVFFAVKRAILAARKDQGETAWFEMEAPATIGTVQQACRVDRSALTLA